MSMDCARARATLWPTDRPRLAGDEVVEARRHVEQCAACRRDLAYDGALLSVFERLREEEAPTEVREAVYGAIARERAGRYSSAGAAAVAVAADATRRSSGRSRAFALGGVVALGALGALGAVGAVLMTTLRPGPPALAESLSEVQDAAAFIDDYMRRAVQEDHVTTSDPELVREFLMRELGVPAALLALEGFELQGAEVCLLEGVRGAIVVYKKDGKVLSYYVLPRRDGPPRPPVVRDANTDVGGGPANVVTWATADAEYALVGTLGAQELLDAARGAQTNR